MEATAIQWLMQLAESTSIPLFILIGSIVEELIPPVPSPFVMTTAGALAEAQHYAWMSLFLIVLFASVIKTISAWIWYVIADKTEDIVVEKGGKKFGISHERLERMGKKLSKGVGDEVAILILRALPIIPTSLVSIMAGFIKLNLNSFLWTTFLGMMIRNTIYLLVGMGLLELAL